MMMMMMILTIQLQFMVHGISLSCIPRAQPKSADAAMIQLLQ